MTDNYRFGGPVCECCYLIPPRLLERLSVSGDPDLASAAARTLRLTASMQAFRAQFEHRCTITDHGYAAGLRRQVFDCSGFDDLPGDPVRSESEPPAGDPAVNQAFEHAGTSWKFYNQIFGRELVDGHGRTLVSSVHYSQNYDNAFWNGQQMVYGDGDGKIFQNFTNSLEVIAHELTPRGHPIHGTASLSGSSGRAQWYPFRTYLDPWSSNGRSARPWTRRIG